MNKGIYTSNASVVSILSTLNINYMSDIDDVSNYHDLYNENKDNYEEDDIAKNCEINTWRKDYFDYLDNIINSANKHS
jgi:hypothetical protein